VALIDLVKQNPCVIVEDLTRRFNVSAQTIRRDLQALRRQGVLTRTYGGAVARLDNRLLLAREHAFPPTDEEQMLKERAIARAAVDLIERGTSVMFDASSAAFALACALPLDVDVTAIVTSLPVAVELSRRPYLNLILIGGTLRPTSFSCTGLTSERALSRLTAHTALIAPDTVVLHRGLAEVNPGEAAMKSIMVANANRVVALIDSSKLGSTAGCFFAPLTAIDIVVTDDAAAPEVVEQVLLQVVKVRVASTDGGPPSTPSRRQIPNLNPASGSNGNSAYPVWTSNRNRIVPAVTPARSSHI
jgi:DeoR/GlpR family transcriptional regulator of sugar metabolism